MEIYTTEKAASGMIEISKEFNVDARIIGRCEASESKKLTITSEYGSYSYFS
jgi:phosphoribosylformylglycinamidine cyclo-ligase